jgi:hypothetical protein
MDASNFSRYIIEQNNQGGEYAIYAGERDQELRIPYDIQPSLEQAERAVEKLVSRDMVEIRVMQWVKDNLPDVMRSAAAAFNLTLDEINFDVRSGTLKALDELCPAT